MSNDEAKPPKPPAGLDTSWILSGTRGWIGLMRCETDLVSWLQFKFSCKRAVASSVLANAETRPLPTAAIEYNRASPNKHRASALAWYYRVGRQRRKAKEAEAECPES